MSVSPVFARRVLELLVDAGPHGLTSVEIAAMLGVKRARVSAALTALRRNGYSARAGYRRKAELPPPRDRSN
jgi:DNA-binding IclR family transcriptional regulator